MDRYRTEIQVTPDRILLECEDIKDHEDAKNPEGNFGFMIHVLDEENTVLTLIQGPVTTRNFCLEQQREIGKIIKNGKIIYIAGHGSLDDPTADSLRRSNLRIIGLKFDALLPLR